MPTDSSPYGITTVTQGPAAISIPTDVPPGETLRYGLIFPFQVAPRTAALACNLRVEGYPVGDFEGGTDIILFDDLSRVSATCAVPVARNETRVDAATGERRIAVKFPVIGGFVPLGALRAGGSPHPFAGTGFGICEALDFPMNEGGFFSWETPWLTQVEVRQFAYDGETFRVTGEELRTENEPLVTEEGGWIILAPGLAYAIPDGDDLLLGVLAAKGDVSCGGVSRWSHRRGAWRPIEFMPVTSQELGWRDAIIDVTMGWHEPTVVRDVDGALLFTARGHGPTDNLVVIWRSTDSGRTWTEIILAEGIREQAPVSINRAADGTPYVAANLIGHGRQVISIWPLNADRSGLEAPITARRAAAGRAQTVDHPNALTVRLADGQWRNAFVYRVMNGDDPTGADPSPQTGSCIEEVTSAGPAVPTWTFA